MPGQTPFSSIFEQMDDFLEDLVEETIGAGKGKEVAARLTGRAKDIWK